MDQQAEKDKTERVIGLVRKTREDIAKWNQMTAMRFQTGGDIRHPRPPFGEEMLTMLARAPKPKDHTQHRVVVPFRLCQNIQTVTFRLCQKIQSVTCTSDWGGKYFIIKAQANTCCCLCLVLPSAAHALVTNTQQENRRTLAHFSTSTGEHINRTAYLPNPKVHFQ